MIRFSSLGSSSAGNSIFVDVDGTKILIDAGLSFKMLQKNLGLIGKSIDEISAVFITHEHGDHVKAVQSIFKVVRVFSEVDGNIHHGEPTTIDRAKITPFRLSHDEPCHGYIIQDSIGNKIAIVTDTGTIPCYSLGFLVDCNAIILEMNHDVVMLTDGKYPIDLQERIFSDEGHLRNEQAKELLELVSWPGLEAVMCYHLSETNNSPALAEYEAYAGVQKESPGCNVVCAHKNKPTDFTTLI